VRRYFVPSDNPIFGLDTSHYFGLLFAIANIVVASIIVGLTVKAKHAFEGG
jgi:hypothetical protein